ncbi:MAG: N-acetylmuramoyl-L-alanine amidase [archaeon]|nr:N-acetylmuramoyl-L-alanine amidase [archaeon]
MIFQWKYLLVFVLFSFSFCLEPEKSKIEKTPKDVKSIEEDITAILDKMHQSDVYQDYFETYSGIKNEDPGVLNFYYEDISEKAFIIHENAEKEGDYTYGEKNNNPYVEAQKIDHNYMIARSMTIKRPYLMKTSTQFITIHDTGNDGKGANAHAHAEYVTTSQVEASWHFTIDDNEIYQHMPIDEVAYHAGDGEHTFKLIDTGVHCDEEEPVHPQLEFSKEDNFLYINGIKSELTTICEDSVCHHKITDAGLFILKGTNGNYWINNYYYNPTYDRISTQGGNYNSVGIESCIHPGTQYSRTMRKLSNLVVRLLGYFNLSPSRVLQHRNFSGKLCPQSMIRARKGRMFNYDNFKFFIETEYLIMTKLTDAKFVYTSNNPDLVDNKGKILKYVDAPTKISYSVEVTYQGVTVKKDYETIIHPINEERPDDN